MRARSITKPEHAVVTQGQINGLVDHIAALIAALDTRVSGVEGELDGRALGILRAAEQDARTQDAILKERVKQQGRWVAASFVVAAISVLVAVVVAMR